MRQTTGSGRRSSEKIVKDIKRATRKQYSSEEKVLNERPSKRGACIIDNVPHNETNQMSQILAYVARALSEENSEYLERRGFA